MDKPPRVHAEWDDVPGLVAESKTIEALMVKLDSLVSELYYGQFDPHCAYPIESLAHR